MTVQTLRPNADVRKLNITHSTGSVAFSLIDDAPDDDTTYVRVVAGQQYPSAYLFVGFTAMSALSANQRILRCKLRGRIRMNTFANDFATIHVKFVDRFTWRGEQHFGLWAWKTSKSAAFVPVEAGWQTTCAPSANSGLPNGEWSKPVVDRIDAFFAWFNSGTFSGSENLRLSEAYLDVDVRDQPVVTGVGLSPATTTRPTATWTYVANADGDPQVAFRVKIFSNDQYLAAGFDPENSASTWDSGELPGTAAQIVVGTDLVNGETYRAYVKAAQDFNGTRWWSAWANSSDLTISLTPPPTPMLVVTPDPTVPWLRNMIQVQATLNMLTGQQASLEDGTTTGWAAGASTTLANATPAGIPHGTKVLQLTRTGSTGTASATTSPSGGVAARAGVVYVARAQFRAAATPRTCQLSLVWKRQDGTTISTSVGMGVTDTTTDFSALAVVIDVAPVETVAVDVLVEVLAAIATEVHYVDAVQVTPFLNRMTADNAEFEATAGTWAVNGNTAAPVRTTAQAKHGVASLLLSSLAGGDMSARHVAGGVNGFVVRAGAKYTAGMSFRAATAGRSSGPIIFWYDNTASLLSSSAGTYRTSTTTGWTDVFVAATAPANAVIAVLVADILATGGANEQHYVDATFFTDGDITTFGVGGLIPGAYVVVEVNWATTAPRNYVNPQFFGGGDGFHRNADGYYTTAGSRIAYDKGQRFHGEGSIRWTPLTTGSVLRIGAFTGELNPTPVYDIAAAPGRTYVFSLYARTDTSFQTRVRLQPLDKDQNVISSSFDSGIFTLTTDWQRIFMSATMPPGTVYVMPFLDNAGAVVGRQVWVDAAQWELGSTPTALQQPGGQQTVWMSVRGAGPGTFDSGGNVGDLPVPADNEVATVFDHEVPVGYHVTYRAKLLAVEPTSGNALSSDVTPYVQTMLDPPGVGTWVIGGLRAHSVVNRMTVQVTDIQESQHEEVTVYYPVRPNVAAGFNQRPVILSDFMGGHDGTLQVVTRTEDEFLLLRQLVHDTSTLWLVYPHFGARYIRIMPERTWTVRRLPEVEDADCAVPPAVVTRPYRRQLTLPFLEVKRPK